MTENHVWYMYMYTVRLHFEMVLLCCVILHNTTQEAVSCKTKLPTIFGKPVHFWWQPKLVWGRTNFGSEKWSPQTNFSCDSPSQLCLRAWATWLSFFFGFPKFSLKTMYASLIPCLLFKFEDTIKITQNIVKVTVSLHIHWMYGSL